MAGGEKEKLPSTIPRKKHTWRGGRKLCTIKDSVVQDSIQTYVTQYLRGSWLPAITGSHGLGSTRISEISALVAGASRPSVVCEWASKRFGGEVSEDLGASLCFNFTFDDMTHLRRGVKLSKVMRGCSSIFASSDGLSEHYDMSRETEKLQYFLSHNWTVPRWRKHLALCFAFNFSMAFGVGLVLAFVLSLLTAFGLTPTLPDLELEIPASMLCRSFLTPVLTCTLLFGSNIRKVLRIGNPIVFLDKVCIHQTDAEAKSQGIGKLGAFLDCSDRMLILYSDVYLRKLWTIYEVANFLILRTIFAMDVVPVQLPTVIFAALPCGYLYTTTLMVWRYLGYANPSGVMQYVIICSFSTFYMLFLRRWAREKVRTKVQLREFDVSTCMCAVEADREIIYEKIADLLRVVHPNLRTASTSKALEVFNEVVRLRMPIAFDLMFGMVTLRYQHLLFIALVVSGVHSADYAVTTGMSQREVICYWLQDAVWFFSLWPAILCEAEVFASSFLWIQQFELPWLWACMIIIAVPFALVHIGLKALERRCDDSELYFALFIGITCSTILGTWVFVASHEAVRASAGRDLDSALPELKGSHPEGADLKQWVDQFFDANNKELQLVHV